MTTIETTLKSVIDGIDFRPGWKFALTEEDGAPYFKIIVTGPDSRAPGNITIIHGFLVPPATYNEKSWRRWCFERICDVAIHEVGEWFTIGRERPFAPLHGPGEDPYTVHEFRPTIDALTNQDGSRDKCPEGECAMYRSGE